MTMEQTLLLKNLTKANTVNSILGWEFLLRLKDAEDCKKSVGKMRGRFCKQTGRRSTPSSQQTKQKMNQREAAALLGVSQKNDFGQGVKIWIRLVGRPQKGLTRKEPPEVIHWKKSNWLQQTYRGWLNFGIWVPAGPVFFLISEYGSPAGTHIAGTHDHFLLCIVTNTAII